MQTRVSTCFCPAKSRLGHHPKLNLEDLLPWGPLPLWVRAGREVAWDAHQNSLRPSRKRSVQI